MAKHYVIYACERLRDGREEWAKICSSLDEALKYINKMAGGFGGCNTEFRLFGLGEEIPLARETVEEPQPSKKNTRFRLAEEGA